MDSAQTQDVSIDQRSFVIDPVRNRFPFCVVWGPLPVISWILPFIGHMGICDSKGRVHDFAGPYHIGVDRFMVGSGTKKIALQKIFCCDLGTNVFVFRSHQVLADQSVDNAARH
jgi:hypothetical protein